MIECFESKKYVHFILLNVCFACKFRML